MSARTFDIGKSKKFGNVKISNSPDKIVVTLHQTDVVVFDKNKKTIRITSGGWQTPTTKTAINNALEQIEKMTGLSLGRISQVKGKWLIEGMEFRDGMIFAARRGTKKNPLHSESKPYKAWAYIGVWELQDAGSHESEREAMEALEEYLEKLTRNDSREDAEEFAESFWANSQIDNTRKSKRNPMRSVSVSETVGEFDDFSPKDQEKIIDNYRDINVDHDWWEYTYEDMTRCLEILGFYKIDINFSGFWSQGDGASFTAWFDIGSKAELKKRLKKLSQEAPDIAEKVKSFGFEGMSFDEEKEDEVERIEVYRSSHHYSHENTITSDNEDLKEFARDFSRLIYRQLEGQYEFLTSDEAVKETFEANEYEFDADTLKISRY